jgi:ketosteroid isomerase-like protein
MCLLGCVAFAAAAVAAQEPKAAPASDVAATLKATEQAWIDAELHHDPAAFEKLVADDWVAITPEGPSETKAERAAEIVKGTVTSATLGPMNVRVFGDTAVVTGSDVETEIVHGKETTGYYVWTDVFVKREGKWLAVASQTTKVQ